MAEMSWGNEVMLALEDIFDLDLFLPYSFP